MISASESPLTQACAVPFRVVEGNVEFCLITSMGQGKWGFPKGLVEVHQTDREAALAEAWEEAGVEGTIIGEPLGSYTYAKWNTTLLVTGFLMRVEHVAEIWPESDVRQRRWCALEVISTQLERKEQAPLVEAAILRDAWSDDSQGGSTS